MTAISPSSPSRRHAISPMPKPWHTRRAASFKDARAPSRVPLPVRAPRNAVETSALHGSPTEGAMDARNATLRIAAPSARSGDAGKHARTRPPRRRTIANRVAPRSSGGASGCWSEPSSAGSLVLVMGSPSLGGRRAASSSLLPSARARFLEGPPSAMPTPPLLARLCAPRRREPLLIRARERRRLRCAAARGERACLLLAVGFCKYKIILYIYIQ